MTAQYANSRQVGGEPDSVPVVFSMNFGDGLKPKSRKFSA
jgi:hypothetical protein